MADINQAQVRTVKTDSKGTFDIAGLVLVAILLAAGFILNMTLGNALAIVGIKPQFIIAAYCLAILILKPNFGQAVVMGVLSAVVIQLTTSIPGLNFLTEVVGALVMCAFVRSAFGSNKVMPLVGAFVTTLVSGLLFAVGGNVIMGAAMATVLVKLPLVLGTAVFNAIVVQVLSVPLKKAIKR